MQKPIDPKTLVGKTIAAIDNHEEEGLTIRFADNTVVCVWCNEFAGPEIHISEPNAKQLLLVGAISADEWRRRDLEERESFHLEHVERTRKMIAERAARQTTER